MSHTAMIRFAPVEPKDAVDRMNAGTLNLDRQWYWRGAFSFLPAETSVPLVVNHDMTQEIGTVRSLFPYQDTDGEWVAALCDVPDPPVWLKRDTPASIQVHRSPAARVPRPKDRRSRPHPRGSVLSPGVEPADPGAKVLTLHREVPKPKREPGLNPGDQVIYGNGQIIRRPAIGQVLGVR